MAKLVKVIGILTARPGRAADLRALLDATIGPSRAEPGNLRWDIWHDCAEPGRFVLDELYADQAAADAHHATPHFAAYAARVGDLAERARLVLGPNDVASQPPHP